MPIFQDNFDHDLQNNIQEYSNSEEKEINTYKDFLSEILQEWGFPLEVVKGNHEIGINTKPANGNKCQNKSKSHVLFTTLQRMCVLACSSPSKM